MIVLVFFASRTCGHSRRMDSLVDHFMRAHRGELKLAKVDVDERADLAARFGVEGAPALVLLSDMVEVARLEGRQTLPSIRAALEPHFVTDELGMPELMLAGEPQLQAIGY